MLKSKRIKKLEGEVKELNMVLSSSRKIIRDYLEKNNAEKQIDYLFSLDNALEEIFCFVKNVDSRLKRLEAKKIERKTKNKKKE